MADRRTVLDEIDARIKTIDGDLDFNRHDARAAKERLGGARARIEDGEKLRAEWVAVRAVWLAHG